MKRVDHGAVPCMTQLVFSTVAAERRSERCLGTVLAGCVERLSESFGAECGVRVVQVPVGASPGGHRLPRRRALVVRRVERPVTMVGSGAWSSRYLH